ncbi:hypothetical protein D3C71_1467710 [compost metagenome]
MTSAACNAAWSPASSKISTFFPGLTSPEMMSQVDTTSSLPCLSTSVCGKPPVATITTSGSSASTVSASAQVLKLNFTPRRSHCTMRQSMMLIISRRRSLRDVNRICPPGWSAASNTVTSWPRSPATRAASRPAGPVPITTTLRLVSALGISWGMVVSRPVAALWMQ